MFGATFGEMGRVSGNRKTLLLSTYGARHAPRHYAKVVSHGWDAIYLLNLLFVFEKS